MLWPVFQKEVEAFNTDRFAEDLIKNAVKAGLNPNKLILVVPLLARSNYESSDIGYSNAICDLGVDPREHADENIATVDIGIGTGSWQ
ncbi:hypothetical protein Pmar_PMAR018397 [Perkinsus marinus ATCC 50983]|uniref:Uncharacterized protein n=1 Tax=Perkinsus marinus (strain ATCC 50983 / TXsc) TaxID=423536 RepID=C5LJE2_PERM5|nr:hypothetical protein Pmar_PMAR018397 [Perkinsus marinus ATCC 50983]EER03142.1 hypothetical protein Pmar_PMAR018397 [Perkinsus marinus ATCC 50983]|eukprot:XP_002771326.1 hypothetical protein Pmar_PMAR018397 [Perkinsus marinus ATCC 50983]